MLQDETLGHCYSNACLLHIIISSGLMKINILERNLVEKPFNCFSLPLKPMRSAWGVKCHRYMYVTSVFYGCIISWLHIVCTPLIPLSFISSMCSLYVPFTITESQQDDNCFNYRCEHKYMHNYS